MSAAVVWVAYGVETLDTQWIPSGVPAVVVHNDERLHDDQASHLVVSHLRPRENLGFGAAVNLALSHVHAARVVLCNPDTSLMPAHWDALTAGHPHELVVVPLRTSDGQPTAVRSPYPTPLTMVLSGFRVGRRYRRDARTRRAVTRLLGRWGAACGDAMKGAGGIAPLTEQWASAGVVSIDVARMREVGGFDGGYFLYYEDTDLCRRLADRFPDMVVREVPVPPGMHHVGGSAGDEAPAVEWHRAMSAARYARTQDGLRWRLVALLLARRAGRMDPG